MARYETGYKIVAGWGATQLIVGIPASVGAAVGAAGKTEEEREKGALKGRAIAGGVASVGSLAMGLWVKNKPGWKATGITQIVFSGISLATAIALGIAGSLPTKIPPLEPITGLAVPTMANKLRLEMKGAEATVGIEQPEVILGVGLWE